MSSGSDDDRLATFEKGEALEVPVGRIEAELAALWRHAAQPRPGEKPRVVTRACLWNLLVRVSESARMPYAKQLIDDVSKSLPARVILMLAEAGEGPGEIHAAIEANWRRPDGGHASGSDEVTLRASGQACVRLPSLARSLVITDAPTAMLWVGEPPGEGARQLLGDVDRLIVDTRKFPEAALVELSHLASDDLELVDLSWLGSSPLRGLCASLFDPPRDPSVLERLDRVRVISGVPTAQSRALLLLGWLASRLGWREVTRGAAEGGLRRWQAVRRQGGAVTIELATQLGGAGHGVVGLELEAGGEKWTLGRDQRVIDAHAPGMPPRVQPVRSHSDAEQLVAALGPRGRDPVFRGALAGAARLVSA